MTQEAPWSMIVLAFVWTTAYLRLPSCWLLILWTLLRSHRGLLVPTNKANDILGNWSRAMHLAWCRMCPHPPPLSTEFQNAVPFFHGFQTSSALSLKGEASIWEGREYQDFDWYRLFLSFASLVTKVKIGSTAPFVCNNIATSHLYLQSHCSPCRRKILWYFESQNRWLASGLQRMKQNINYPPAGTPFKVLYGEAPPKRGTFSDFRYMKEWEFYSLKYLKG